MRLVLDEVFVHASISLVESLVNDRCEKLLGDASSVDTCLLQTEFVEECDLNRLL